MLRRPRVPPFDPQRFADAKRKSFGQVLLKAARLFNEQALQVLRDRTGLSQIRAVHTTVLPHLELDGIRITDLAQRVGVTKQAVGQIVTELEDLGLLERVADPSDGRAKLVVFTESGKQSLFVGLAALARVEEELAKTLGKRRMRDGATLLSDLLDALEAQGAQATN